MWTWAITKEVIIADDGSTDATPQVIQEHSKDSMIKVHTSPVNLGKGAAVRLGLSYATGDIVLIQDADLELDPAEHTRMIAPIIAGHADIVYGSRFLQKSNKIPFRTRLANRFLTLLTNVLFRARLSDMETAYKAFRREVVTVCACAASVLILSQRSQLNCCWLAILSTKYPSAIILADQTKARRSLG